MVVGGRRRRGASRVRSGAQTCQLPSHLQLLKQNWRQSLARQFHRPAAQGAQTF